MPDRGRDASIAVAASQSARRVVLGAFAVLGLMLVLLLVERAVFIEIDRSARVRIEAAQAVAREIEVLDVELTMAANLGARAAPQLWKPRYDALTQRMLRAEARAKALASPALAQRFTQTTFAANEALVVLEEQAFALARDGRFAEAVSRLDSDAYAKQKRVLRLGSEAFLRDLQREAADDAAYTVRVAWGIVAALCGVTVGVLVLLWRHLGRRLARSEAAFRTRLDADEVLRESERRKAWILDGADAGTWFWDATTDTMSVNARAAAIVGLAPDDPACRSGTFWRDRTHPHDRESHAAALRRHLRGDAPNFEAEIRVTHRDGHWVWVVERGAVAERDADGRAVAMAGTITDVTERRRATDALRSSLALVDALFQAIPLPVAMQDLRGRIQRMNRAWVEHHGRPAHELEAESVQLQADPAMSRRREAEQVEMARTRQPLVSEFRGPLRGRAQVEAVVRKAPIIDNRGEMAGVVTTIVDITEQSAAARALEAAKDAAEAANRAKSAFLATMSHEIRTPMNGVLGMSELLSRTSLDAGQQQTVRTIRHSATALLTIIDDILDFSKIEAGQLALEDGEFAPGAIAEQVCESLVAVATERRVELMVWVAADVPAMVAGDSTRVRQVLTNLVGNAIKFSGTTDASTGAEGRVAVRVHVDTARLCLEVADNGIGMDAPTVERLFQPFMQAEVSTTRRFGGTGLGLAITRRLVHLMGGEITVASAPGAGSSFTVQLPLAARAPAEAFDAPSLPAGTLGILVDAAALPIEALSDWMTQAGIAVAVAADDADALRQAAAAPGLSVIVRRAAGAIEAALDTGGDDVRWLLLGRDRDAAARRDSARVRTLAWLRRDGVVEALAALTADTSDRRSTDLDPRESEVDATLPGRRRDGDRPLVLVAEDDAINRAVIVRQLAVLGYAAELADNGLRALERWRDGRYAVVITDLHMPEMDGYALAAAIRAEETHRGGRTPVIALTANALKGEEQRALEAGMDEYLTKPILLPHLGAALARHVPRATATATRVDAPNAAPVFDAMALRMLVGDDAESVAALLAEFRVDAARQVDALQRALQTADLAAAGHAAHRLKSAAKAVGALALGEHCATIEARVRDGRVDASAAARLAEALALHWREADAAVAEALVQAPVAGGATA
jgi:PAS domain S-box-containing protein